MLWCSRGLAGASVADDGTIPEGRGVAMDTPWMAPHGCTGNACVAVFAGRRDGLAGDDGRKRPPGGP